MQRFLIITALFSVTVSAEAEPLPSWEGGESKQRIIAFVEAVTNPNTDTFVPQAQRIATFDNDGCLWAEQPMYFQLAFAFDRIKAMAADHPEWKKTEPFKSVLADDLKGVMASGKPGLVKIIAATHTGMTTETFRETVGEWLNTAKHPSKEVLYKELVYQPQLELLDYLRTNGFKTFIVSGGGIDFLRVFAEEVYGIPPETGGRQQRRRKIRNP